MEIKINEELIKRVATVSRLNLTQEEIIKFTEDFKSILNAFDKVTEIDVSDISDSDVSAHAIPLEPILREDIPKPCLSQEDALKNSTHNKDGYFKGPKSI
ncbi:Asp-tRNA(Asn)/Glu-tRNA(Gln) amidotransferase subunit GatC [Candidatus Woesearchaeota archaeon]|jgi:aspartyl-tRNA(Asn)/glutamyl-tRNA(Gln) amidotransferase subunit C|nr:Asp-tRNA(Asn)/Glu-tRNA(Gln) amidotransferase subunit GatC [Candidatus Woesearchaeota archaeon]